MASLRLLVAISALLLFVGLDASTIWDANEAYYTETPRQMVLTGDYINPSFNDAPRFNKPVLSYWVVAGAYHALGVSVWAERVAIAVGTIGIAMAAFVIARVVWSARAGWIAALVLLSAPRVVFFSRRIFIDVWITMFMSLVLMFFVLAEMRPQHRRRYLLLMYVAAGLGVLTKGPVAIVLPALAFGLYLVVQRRARDILRLQLLPGVLIVAALVVPWYAMVYSQHGWDYITAFFIGENVSRYADTVGAQHRSVLFYVPVLLTELFPWSLLVPAAFWIMGRRAFSRRRSSEDARVVAPLRLLLLWIAVIVMVFTFSSTKQDLYIFPIVAALAALIAGLIDRAFAGELAEARALKWTLPIIAVALLALGVALQRTFGEAASPYFIQGAWTAGLLLAAGGISIAGCWALRRIPLAVAAVGTTVVAVNITLVLVALPDFERFKPAAPLSAAALARNPDARVVQYRIALPSMVWYLGKPVEEVLDPPVLQARLRGPGETLVVLPKGDYEAVRDLADTCIIDRRPLLDVKLSELLAGTARPEMLLISNRCD